MILGRIAPYIPNLKVALSQYDYKLSCLAYHRQTAYSKDGGSLGFILCKIAVKSSQTAFAPARCQFFQCKRGASLRDWTLFICRPNAPLCEKRQTNAPFEKESLQVKPSQGSQM